MNVYDLFCEEMDSLTIESTMSAVQVVAIMTRAVKRAQLVLDEELAPVAKRVQK